MQNILRLKPVLISVLLTFVSAVTYSQAPNLYFYENEFDLNFGIKEKWSMDIGFGNRGMLAEREGGAKVSGYQHEHIELNQFTNYNPSEALMLSLGLRYRFKELFDNSETNEFRIIQQVEYEPGKGLWPVSHRLRLEQRIREDFIHRLRYELGVSKELSEVFSLELSTESLYSVASGLKPEAEQRVALGIENKYFNNLEIEVNFEYRMENYVRDLVYEFFIVTGFTLGIE